jgi:4-amino-4-deoxy-L-arabinose transferase-like glycosyltransferase
MPARTATAPTLRARTGGWQTAVVVALACCSYGLYLNEPGFFDNEGRYAEVARQMQQTGDWITPRLDDTLFLNKPPLAFWLTGVAFEIFGRSEWARVVPLIAMGIGLFATARLGALLYGQATGVLAALFGATTVGVILEARTLRPDALLLASVATTLLCWAHAVRAAPEQRTAWLVGLYTALGLGVLAKGLVPVILVAPVIAWGTWSEGGWPALRQMRPVLGTAIFAALVLPWHALVAWRHEGFAWDYVVNQHLLFFLDRKLPRDSEGDPLWFFWTAFGLRALPWIALVPLAGGRGNALPWIWLGTVLGFFSLAPSRLEHYALPALPAMALLAARGAIRLLEGTAPEGGWRLLQASGGLLGLAGIALLTTGERLLRGAEWIAQAPALAALASPAGIVLLLVGTAVGLGTLQRRAELTIAALGVGSLAMAAIIVRALIAAEPLFSWRPVAAIIDAQLPSSTEIVFESPEEYQLVGGLSYYLDRHVTLLAFPNFVPPTYLADHFRSMFLPRDQFAARWQSDRRLAFVSDPQRPRDTPAGLVPGPFHVITHLGDRWVLTNTPPPAAR